MNQRAIGLTLVAGLLLAGCGDPRGPLAEGGGDVGAVASAATSGDGQATLAAASEALPRFAESAAADQGWDAAAVVALLEQARAQQVDVLVRLAEGRVASELEALPGVDVIDSIDLGGAPVVQLAIGPEADAALVDALVERRVGDALALNTLLRPAAAAVLPNDPAYRYQWELAPRGAGAINAPAAWGERRDGSGVIVAVLDTGAARGLRDLEGNLLPGYDATTGRPSSGDRVGHGTAVCGIIGARGDDGSGVAGVCWDARILPIDVFGRSWGASQFSLVRGLRYAVQQGARVINMSLGGPGANRIVFDTLREASRAGAIIVVAAGNESASNDRYATYPANYPVDTLIAVGASRYDGRRSRLSNYGSRVLIAAPGEDVVTLTPRGRLQYLSGTSFSAPYVSGALALAWSARPRAAAHEVLAALLDGASRRRDLARYFEEGRLLDVAATLQRIGA